MSGKKYTTTPEDWIHSDEEFDELLNEIQEPSEGIVATVQEACRKAAGIEIELGNIGYQIVADGLVSHKEFDNYLSQLNNLPPEVFGKFGHKIDETSKIVVDWRTCGLNKPKSLLQRFKEYFSRKLN